MLSSSYPERMDRFASCSMTSEELHYNLRIEQFSMGVLKGHFESPEFGISATKWSLLVRLNDGADYDNYIDVRLSRRGCQSEELFVKAKVSIVGFLGPSQEREMWFRGERRDAQVLAVTKKNVLGRFGLKKLWLLRHDMLTLDCKLVVYEDNARSFSSQRDFEENVADPGSRSVEYFAHVNRMKNSKPFDFTRQFRNFSLYSRRGSCVSPEFRSAERPSCSWSLVVKDASFQNESFEVRLRRNDSLGTGGEFAKVKLSVVDCRRGKVLLSKVKQVYFRGSLDEDTTMLKFARKDLAGLTPDDTLTLRCEIELCEETVATFDRKSDFERSVHNRGDSTAAAWLIIVFELMVLAGGWFGRCDVLPLIVNYAIQIIGFFLQPILQDLFLFSKSIEKYFMKKCILIKRKFIVAVKTFVGYISLLYLMTYLLGSLQSREIDEPRMDFNI